MRVLMLCQNVAGHGGTYARCFALARGLAALGHAVTLLAAPARRRPWPRAELRDGVRVIESAGLLAWRVRHGGLDPADLAARLAALPLVPADVIHTFDHRPAVVWPARLARWIWRAPIVADWCDLWGGEGWAASRTGLEHALLAPLDSRLEALSIAGADAVTTITTELERRARGVVRPGVPVQLLPPGASDDRIRPLAAEAARVRHGLPPDASILVLSGHSSLGERLLGEAMLRVVRRRPSTLLLQIGSRLPGLERILAEAGLSDRLRPLGVRSHQELGSLLACGDVMLLPRPDTPVARSGFPNRLGDYLAAGRPVVTNPTGELGELVRREQVGLVASEDPEHYAAAIVELLGDPERRRTLGRRARALAETSFSWRARAEVLAALYQGLSSARAQVPGVLSPARRRASSPP